MDWEHAWFRLDDYYRQGAVEFRARAAEFSPRCQESHHARVVVAESLRAADRCDRYAQKAFHRGLRARGRANRARMAAERAASREPLAMFPR